MDRNTELALVPVRLLDGSTYELADVVVYQALSNRQKYFVDDLVGSTGLSTSTVLRSLKRLRTGNLVEVVESGTRWRPTRFRLPDLEAGLQLVS